MPKMELRGIACVTRKHRSCIYFKGFDPPVRERGSVGLRSSPLGEDAKNGVEGDRLRNTQASKLYLFQGVRSPCTGKGFGRFAIFTAR